MDLKKLYIEMANFKNSQIQQYFFPEATKLVSKAHSKDFRLSLAKSS